MWEIPWTSSLKLGTVLRLLSGSTDYFVFPNEESLTKEKQAVFAARFGPLDQNGAKLSFKIADKMVFSKVDAMTKVLNF